uniref:Ribosomal RNA-processing protein 40 n=1 Tax=Rhodosorus marinus TaxID=101924 RepID=A0A7S3ENW1_9RHOD|mmetsp:Transcript_9211/g.40279  ORF Transcript_9211/g.40279 Transcript_9211/m.40279 type:complete len:255 (+) Transcript_9211:130-894(+)|eukprot:CAMPEP_0113960416 /NCGR_PEP_ID=MMETSP0011_2-20120614/4697_1 /TAXON_ID=101924 /ORGANISM="Rhodosorus marinus" /LENGTH=254 /DNA_ID=CAMNT_0000971855 /DNA_START=127 /DNA_END=891 /DNA_ORIENTATION=- /assembly_acc=CAM_ASM_000156
MPSTGFLLKVEEGLAVFPGDRVANVSEAQEGSAPSLVRLGPGVRRDGDAIVAMKAGLVRVQAERSKIWVESGGRRYVPALEDMVIGVVVDRHGEGYRVDIGSYEAAQLGSLSFEGATKRNRPYLNLGALVYARVVSCDKVMEPEISCIQPGSSKSWVSGESLFGELIGGGQLIKISLASARGLLKPSCTVLNALGEALPKGFECVIGTNGRVWVRASTPSDTVVVVTAIRMAEVGTLGPDANKTIRSLVNSRSI